MISEFAEADFSFYKYHNANVHVNVCFSILFREIENDIKSRKTDFIFSNLFFGANTNLSVDFCSSICRLYYSYDCPLLFNKEDFGRDAVDKNDLLLSLSHRFKRSIFLGISAISLHS